MLSWLKDILGDSYNEEVEKKISQEIGKSFVAKADFNAKNEQLKALEVQVRERDTQLDTLKQNVGNSEELKKQIEALQAENKQKDTTYAEQMKSFKVGAALDKALSEARAINPATVKPLLAKFLEKAELDADGTIKGLNDEIGKLAKAEDTSFLFKAASTAVAGASPAGSVTATPDPKVSGYEARLADARKSGNSALAVAIKREAAAQGVTLY